LGPLRDGFVLYPACLLAHLPVRHLHIVLGWLVNSNDSLRSPRVTSPHTLLIHPIA
jgi:hypothetical protein